MRVSEDQFSVVMYEEHSGFSPEYMHAALVLSERLNWSLPRCFELVCKLYEDGRVVLFEGHFEVAEHLHEQLYDQLTVAMQPVGMEPENWEEYCKTFE